jgi:hypothetical protein
MQGRNSTARKRARTVVEAIREGDGRYPFGRSIYLVVRGGSALWEYQFRQDRRLRTLALGSAVARVPSEQPTTITDARAKRDAAWLARRNGEVLPAAGHAGKRFAQAAKDYLESASGRMGTEAIQGSRTAASPSRLAAERPAGESDHGRRCGRCPSPNLDRPEPRARLQIARVDRKDFECRIRDATDASRMVATSTQAFQ